MKNIGWIFFLLIGIVLNTYGQDAVKSPAVKITALNEFGQEDDGSGVIIGEKATEIYIVTAAHVVPSSENIKVTFLGGATVPAQIVKINASLDIATLKCMPPAGFKTSSFALAKSEEKALQSVIVIGHPLGNNWDINFNTNVKETEFDLDDRLFTLAPIGITPGNSGGPVLNQQYELLGLVQNVDPVKAVCVDVATLMKACLSWDVPTNLMTGVEVEQKEAEAGDEDFRYKLFLQEANSAYAAKKWEQAKKAFAEVYAIAPKAEIESRIKQCDVEIAKDKMYEDYFTKGKNASSLEGAMGLFEQARAQRDTEEVRERLRQTRERLSTLGVQQAEITSNTNLKDKITDPILGDLILVRGGTFMMGTDDHPSSEDQFPAHQVLLSDFYMAAREVTISQWCEYLNDAHMKEYPLEETEKWQAEQNYWESVVDDYHGKWDGTLKVKKIMLTQGGKNVITFRLLPRDENEKNDAARELSKIDAYRYCQWLSSKHKRVYRLPTEAEWEYAARGGQKSKGFKYAGTNDIDDLYFFHNSAGDVSSKIPNELGLYNMSNNVTEWVSDLYKKDYYLSCKLNGTMSDPKGPDTGEPLCRGGYFGLNYPKEIEVTRRIWVRDYFKEAIGLRVVMSPYEEFKEDSQKGRLGVGAKTLEIRKLEKYGLPSPTGVLVEYLLEDGAGMEAGIEVGDVILQVNEDLVRDLTHFIEVIAHHAPGEKVTIKVLRDKTPLTLEATLKSAAD